MSEAPMNIVRKLVVRAVAAAGIAAVAAFLVAGAMDDQYQSTVQLVMTPTPFETMQGIEGQIISGNEPNWRINVMKLRIMEALTLPDNFRLAMNTPPQHAHRTRLTMPDYALLFKNSDLVLQLRSRLEEKDGSGSYPLEAVAGAMEVRTRIVMQTHDEVVYQELLDLTFTAADPEIAAFGANTWAAICLEAVQKIHADRMGNTRSFVETQGQALRTSRDENRTKLERFESSFDVAAMSARLEAFESQLTALDLRQIELQQEQKILDAELAALYYSEEPPVKQRTTSYRAETESPVSVREEAPQWREQMALERKLRAAGLKEELALHESTREQLGKETDALRVQLAHARTDQEALLTEAEQLKRRLDEFESAELLLSDSGPAFSKVAEAPVPESQVGPHRTLIVAAAALFATVAAVVLTFGQVALNEYAARMGAPTPAQRD